MYAYLYINILHTQQRKNKVTQNYYMNETVTIQVKSVSVGAANWLLWEHRCLQTQGHGHEKGWRCTGTRLRMQFTEVCGQCRWSPIVTPYKQTNQQKDMHFKHALPRVTPLKMERCLMRGFLGKVHTESSPFYKTLYSSCPNATAFSDTLKTLVCVCVCVYTYARVYTLFIKAQIN